MKEQSDREVERLLREYQADLRRQTPPDLLARLHEEQRRVRPSRVIPFPSRTVMGGLALAASLVVMVAVFRTRPEQKVAPPALETASVAATERETRASAPGASAAQAPAPLAKPTAPESKPAAVVGALASALAPSPAPASGAAASQTAAKAESGRAEDKVAPIVSVPVVTSAPAEPAHTLLAPAHTLMAIVVQEVWEPGQLARVSSGTYQRLADGREVRSVLAPVEAPPMAQNSYGLAAPSQQMSVPQGAMTAPRESARRLAPVRDQIAEARSRVAAPQITPLGEAVVEGFRCTGTRTLDGERSVERWRSPELGLDLLVRTTEANGAQLVVRYTRIERH